jgi:NADPH2:quinone reductase
MVPLRGRGHDRRHTMKAAVFMGKHQIEIKELARPEVQSNEVLLKVIGCGVCGTDAHIYQGEIKDAVPPVVIGHEILGEVTELGREASGVQVGDRVVLDPFVFCNFCDFCKAGEFRFCLNERFIGYHRTGGFSQYTTVPYTNLYRVPKTMTLKQGILCEPLSTVIAGYSRLQPEAGKSFLILGEGALGLIWNQVIRNSLSVTLIQTGIIPERLAKVEKLGADRVVNPKEEKLEKAVYDLCPYGVDYIVDCTGSTKAIGEALPLIKRGGTFLSFGVCPEDERLSLSLYWLYRKQIRIISSRRPPKEFQRSVDFMKRGLIDADIIVTRVFPLTKIEEAFQTFSSDRATQIKTAIDPWLEAS